MKPREGSETPILDPLTLDPDEEMMSPPPPARVETGPGLTADGRLRSGKLAGLTMGRAIWVLAWPILAESMLNSLVGLTDTVLAAQISQAATDAIGAASYVLWFVGLIAMAVGIGATALVSRAVGGSRMAVAHAATGQAVVLAAVSGTLAAALLAASAWPAAGLMNLSPAGAAAFRTYLLIVSLSVPAMSVMAAGIACARGAGDSIRPLSAMVVVNLVNMGLSWVLAGCDYVIAKPQADGAAAVTRTLIHNPSPWHLGVAGVAWGTVIGEYVGAVIVLVMLARGSSGVQLMRRRMRPHWHTLRRLVRVGLPNFLETLGMWLGNFAVILLVGLIGRTAGEGVMGAHIVAVRIEAFSFLPGFAMGTAAAALAGQYLGAGAPEMARRAIYRCAAGAATFMGVAGLLFMIIPRTITGLVTAQPVHLELVPKLIFLAGIVQIPFGISNVLRSALRGVGDGRAVMRLIWFSTYGVRLPLVVLLSGVPIPLPCGLTIPSLPGLEPSLSMLWAALCIEVAVRSLLIGRRFRQGHWMSARV